jgi:predicted DNA-binding transcriptional regulator YafY
MVDDVLKGLAAYLWPENTAAHLATELDCSVRTVERYMEGSRDWSTDAIAAMVGEIMRRRKMRNFKVKGRGNGVSKR